MDASLCASEFLKFRFGGSTAVLYPAFRCNRASPLLALMVIRRIGAHLASGFSAWTSPQPCQFTV